MQSQPEWNQFVPALLTQWCRWRNFRWAMSSGGAAGWIREPPTWPYEGDERFLVFFGFSGTGGGGASNCSANSRSDEGGPE